MTKKPRILIVDDERINVRILNNIFREEYEISVALNATQALQRIRVKQPDLILLDIQMPDMDGYQLCQRLKADPATKNIAIIFITSMSSEEDETKGLSLGAVDYITKPVQPGIALARVRTHLEIQHQKEILSRLSSQDGLTGIANRRRFDEQLQREWQHCMRNQMPLALILLDIDHFKAYNDYYGHSIGDDCLRNVAWALQKALQRPMDLLARYGGEEFACILPETNLEDALAVAETLRQQLVALDLRHKRSPTAAHVTASLGVAALIPTLESAESSPTLLIEQADKRLYEAKRKGRNQVVGHLVPVAAKTEKRHKKTDKWELLIVDDEPINIRLLSAIFKDTCETRVAHNGAQALQQAQESPPPNMILLDIQMPDMSGYEVCRRIKANPQTREIPIIFITALTSKEKEIKGLELGAVDYITKPFQPTIVHARVRTHLSLQQARAELALRNSQLEEMLVLRENMEAISRHDLKHALSSIIGLAPRLLEQNNITAEQKMMLRTMESSGYRLLEMVNRSLDMLKMEQGNYELQPQAVDVLLVIQRILGELVPLTEKSKTARLTVDGHPAGKGETFTLQGEELLFSSLFANLIKNALEANSDKAIAIDLTRQPIPTIRIHNEGVVPMEIHGQFFEKYVISGHASGAGLGTYSAKLITDTLGGSIEMTSSATSGTTVSVAFARQQAISTVSK